PISEVPLRELLPETGLALEANEAVQRADARIECPVQGMCCTCAVQRGQQRLTHPGLLRERVPVGSLLDLDVLPLQTHMRDDPEARLAAEVCESELRLRVDRVDLTRADRLDLGVRVRDEAEHDRVKLRFRSIPAAVVARQGDAGAAVEPGQEEGAVRDRGVSLLRVADAILPDSQQ